MTKRLFDFNHWPKTQLNNYYCGALDTAHAGLGGMSWLCRGYTEDVLNSGTISGGSQMDNIAIGTPTPNYATYDAFSDPIGGGLGQCTEQDIVELDASSTDNYNHGFAGGSSSPYYGFVDEYTIGGLFIPTNTRGIAPNIYIGSFLLDTQPWTFYNRGGVRWNSNTGQFLLRYGSNSVGSTARINLSDSDPAWAGYDDDDNPRWCSIICKVNRIGGGSLGTTYQFDVWFNGVHIISIGTNVRDGGATIGPPINSPDENDINDSRNFHIGKSSGFATGGAERYSDCRLLYAFGADYDFNADVASPIIYQALQRQMLAFGA